MGQHNETSENVQYLPMTLERHNPQDVAGLIYESAPELFSLMFGFRAISHLTDLVGRSHNRFSHQYIRVAELNQQIVGIITFLPAEQVNDNADYRDSFSTIQNLWLKLLERFLLQYLLQHVYPKGSYYISNLAVATEYRNRGIGRQLLTQCIAEAAVTSSPIFISVDVSNGRAQKLYESLGFQVVDLKAIRLLGTQMGSRVLRLPTS